MDTALLLLRAVATVLLACATGAMARFYYSTERRMPGMAFVAWLCFSVPAWGALAVTATHRDPFQWWVSPPIIAGSLLSIVVLWPHLTLRDRTTFEPREGDI